MEGTSEESRGAQEATLAKQRSKIPISQRSERLGSERGSIPLLALREGDLTRGGGIEASYKDRVGSTNRQPLANSCGSGWAPQRRPLQPPFGVDTLAPPSSQG